MISLDVPIVENGEEKIVKEKAYNINDFPYERFNHRYMPKLKKKKCYYYNLACAFDIETTTIESKNKDVEKDYAFMYQWQFCIHDTVCFGRTWEEFLLFLHKLKKHFELADNNKLVIYVHNLAYEFQFIKDFIPIDSLFAKDKRKPLKFTSGGFEFRCSYFLSNMSLAKFCENTENVKHYKLKDTYDYKKLRTPETPLTNEEMAYCYNDVAGLCECINQLLKEDDITTIPLTNTGYVRRDYRKAMAKNRKNWYQFQKMRLTPELYRLLKEAFRGGNTHANRFLANTIIENVHSKDLQSSYPAVMLMGDYPMSPFSEIKLNDNKKIDYYCEKYCVVMEVEYFNISVNNDVVIPYLDIAHCKQRSNVINDNGRVLSADYVRVSLTNIDYEIIRGTYKYDGFRVIKAYYAKKGKLPLEFRKTLIDYYTAKTQLKGVDGKEYEYLKSKNKVNSSFGMCVTAIDHEEITYNKDTMEWKSETGDLQELLDDFYNNRNNFLSYQWGVFVTANARKALQDMLDVVKEDVVYIDTDSIKFVGDEHIAEFDELNKYIIERCENNDIPAYAIKDNKKYYLGIWDDDGDYLRFKTLGAKKYCYDIKEKDGTIGFHITVAGMNKKNGAKIVGSIENFNIGQTYFEKVVNGEKINVGRSTSTYNDIKPHKITVNGCTFLTASNIAVVDSTYTLGVTNEYWELIQYNNTNNDYFE